MKGSKADFDRAITFSEHDILASLARRLQRHHRAGAGPIGFQHVLETPASAGRVSTA
jgi:hypothetical protein